MAQKFLDSTDERPVMVGLGDELFGGQRTCAPSERAEYNDWDIVAGGCSGEQGGRFAADLAASRFNIHDDKIGPLGGGDLSAAGSSASFKHFGAAPREQRSEQIARFARTIDDEHARSGGQRRVSKPGGQGGEGGGSFQAGAENTRAAAIRPRAVLEKASGCRLQASDLRLQVGKNGADPMRSAA